MNIIIAIVIAENFTLIVLNLVKINSSLEKQYNFIVYIHQDLLNLINDITQQMRVL